MIQRRNSGWQKKIALLSLLVAVPGVASSSSAQTASSASACADIGNVTLSPGFCATIFADNLGHARHMVVAPNGVVYVNTWSGRYYANDKPPAGGFLLALKDGGAGKAATVERFGDSQEQGSAGGTGIALYNGFVYAEMNDRIVRYKLPANGMSPTGKSETVLSGMPLEGDHPMHPFTIDAKGNIFVNMGSASNACQVANRQETSPGASPCKELETRGGIWRYDANKLGQVFSPAERYATGIRNAVGVALDGAGRLFTTQHGRDQLAQNWPALYKAEQGADLPAEELMQVERGNDFGWPMCYFDGAQQKLVLAPEYGGDGGKAVGLCAQKKAPTAFFPAHWAPNDIAFYTGTQFPAPFRNGAFVAFHGSWNRAPGPQAGYNVVFQPMADGKPSGSYVVFADGFAGAKKEPGQAAFRPTGLAIAPDGTLYIADDTHGRIWSVTFQGPANAQIAAAPAPAISGLSPEASPEPTLALSTLPLPPGVTLAQLTLGSNIYKGEAKGGTCGGCHGSDAKGSPVGPGLVSGPWIWGDGSLKSITNIVTKGVPKPKRSTGVMPPMGGVKLSKSDVAAVSAYVWAIGHADQAPKAK